MPEPLCPNCQSEATEEGKKDFDGVILTIHECQACHFQWLKQAPNFNKQKLRRGVLKMLEQYIAEAEHQDGLGYWDQFASPDQVLDDFLSYWIGRSVDFD